MPRVNDHVMIYIGDYYGWIGRVVALVNGFYLVAVNGEFHEYGAADLEVC